MSVAEVELARRGYEAIARGDFGVLFDVLAPDVEWRAVQDTTTHRGREGVERSISSWTGTWNNWRLEAEEFVDAGEHVVVTVRSSGSGKESGVPVAQRYFQVLTIRDGRIVRFREFADREEALRAAGVAD